MALHSRSWLLFALAAFFSVAVCGSRANAFDPKAVFRAATRTVDVKEEKTSEENKAKEETADKSPSLEPSTADEKIGVAGSTSLAKIGPAFGDKLPYCAILGKVVCEADFPLDSVSGLEAEIEQLQLDLVGYLGAPEAREKIELCVFKSKESYLDFIKSVFPGAPLDRPALYIKDSGPGVLMVVRNDRLIINIRHEMTHAYLNASLRQVPIWIDEGLAKYFEVPPGERGYRNPYLKDVEAKASRIFSQPPSLTRLEKLTRVDQMHPREYRESWAWTHFLIHYSPETHKALASYLRSLQPGAPQEEDEFGGFLNLQKKTPLKARLDRILPDNNKRYIEHFKNWDKGRDSYENGPSPEKDGDSSEREE